MASLVYMSNIDCRNACVLKNGTVSVCWIVAVSVHWHKLTSIVSADYNGDNQRHNEET